MVKVENLACLKFCKWAFERGYRLIFCWLDIGYIIDKLRALQSTKNHLANMQISGSFLLEFANRLRTHILNDKNRKKNNFNGIHNLKSIGYFGSRQDLDMLGLETWWATELSWPLPRHAMFRFSWNTIRMAKMIKFWQNLQSFSILTIFS